MFYLNDNSRFIKKFFNTLLAALAEMNIDPLQSMVVIHQKNSIRTAVLIKNTPFTKAEKALILSLPRKVFTVSFVSPAEVARAKNRRLLSDDNPSIGSIISTNTKVTGFFERAFIPGAPLFILLFISLGIYVCFLVFPLLKNGGSKGEFVRQGIYFLCIGLGYIILELTLINKFTLFLINPTYSIAVTLSSILFLGGWGWAVYLLYILRAGGFIYQ